MTKNNPKKSNLNKAARARGGDHTSDARSEWHEHALRWIADTLENPDTSPADRRPKKLDPACAAWINKNIRPTRPRKPVSSDAVARLRQRQGGLLENFRAERREFFASIPRLAAEQDIERNSPIDAELLPVVAEIEAYLEATADPVVHLRKLLDELEVAWKAAFPSAIIAPREIRSLRALLSRQS